MAQLVSIDYNPLRRAISKDYESRAAGYTAERISLTRQTLSNQVWANALADKRVEIQKMKLREADREAEAQRGWQIGLGVVKTAGAVALGVLSGGTMLPAAIGMGLSGITDVAGGISGENLSGLQSMISVGTQVAQAGYDYKTRENDQGAAKDFAALAAAKGAALWSIGNSGEITFNPSSIQPEVDAITKQYGERATKQAMDNWETSHLNRAASDYLNNLQQRGTAIANTAVNAASTRVAASTPQEAKRAVDQMFNEIEPVTRNMTPEAAIDVNEASGAQLIKNMIGEEGQRAYVNGGRGAVEAAMTGGGDKAQVAFAALEEKIGTARMRELGVEVKVGPGGVKSYSYTPDEQFKNQVLSDGARAQKELITALSGQAQERFDTVLSKGGAIAAAMQAAMSVTEGVENKDVVSAVASEVASKQIAALDNQFYTDFNNNTGNPNKLGLMLENYEKGGVYADPKAGAGDYMGNPTLRSDHYKKLKTAVDALNTAGENRLKKEDADAVKVEDQKIKDLQGAVADHFLLWQIGEYSGDILLNEIYNQQDILIPDDKVKWTEAIVTGSDNNPVTSGLFKSMQSTLTTAKVSPERQAEIMQSLYQTRMGIEGKDFKPLGDAIERITRVEQAKFLSKGLASMTAGGSIAPDVFNKFIKSGTVGDLDPYFYDVKSVKTDETMALSLNTTNAVVGGKDMGALAETVKTRSRQQMMKLLGKDPGELIMATDKTGDREGYFTAKLDSGEKIRLNVNEGTGAIVNPYFIEKQDENGKWVKYEPEKVVKAQQKGAKMKKQGRSRA
jgi:hypothetical protein